MQFLSNGKHFKEVIIMMYISYELKKIVIRNEVMDIEKLVNITTFLSNAYNKGFEIISGNNYIK